MSITAIVCLIGLILWLVADLALTYFKRVKPAGITIKEWVSDRSFKTPLAIWAVIFILFTTSVLLVK